jgi:hypothetical protein
LNSHQQQSRQVSSVIREINNLHRDIQYIIIITSAPQLRIQGELPLFTRETSQLATKPTSLMSCTNKKYIETDLAHECQWHFL